MAVINFAADLKRERFDFIEYILNQFGGGREIKSPNADYDSVVTYRVKCKKVAADQEIYLEFRRKSDFKEYPEGVERFSVPYKDYVGWWFWDLNLKWKPKKIN
jgi:hypothetical protein